MDGYCVKCRKKREIQEPVEEEASYGRRYLLGKCPVCSKTICRFLKKRQKGGSITPPPSPPPEETHNNPATIALVDGNVARNPRPPGRTNRPRPPPVFPRPQWAQQRRQ